MDESAKEKKRWFGKKNILAIVFLSIALSFTVFFFSPIDVFLGNQTEFNINAYYIIFPMLILAVLASIALMLIMSLSLLHRTVYNIITSLLFGILLAFYIQMLLFNGNLQILDGNRAFDLYSEINPFNMINFITIYIIVMLPLILTFMREKNSKDSGIMGAAKGKVIPYVSAALFIMQLTGTVGMFASNGLIKTDHDQYVYRFSFDPIMSLSEEENITVFLMDMLDGRWMNETLDRYPEMNEKLEGFTYYKNNVSCYNYTFPSVSCMLTNEVHEPQKGKYDFLNKAFAENSLPGRLYENGYRVNIIPDIYNDINELSQLSECSNIVPFKVEDYSVNYTGKNGIVYTMMNLSMTKLMPYFLKCVFIIYLDRSVDENFMISDNELPDELVYTSQPMTDVKFNHYLNKCGLRTDSEQKTFSFIHMNGAHNESSAISKLYSQSEEIYTIHTTIRGNFETIFTYCDMMKELGVYDNSTIIIVADHPFPAAKAPSALFIKTKNAERLPLQTDQETEMSNKYFYPSVLEYAGIDHSEYGYSYNDVIYKGASSERYVAFDSTSRSRQVFRVNGYAGDESNWEQIS